MRNPLYFLPNAVLLGSLLASSVAQGADPSYQTVNATEFGKAFVTQRKDARSVKTALQLTLRDITRYFGVAPSVYSAYADSKDPHSGGATFLVNAGDVAVKGLVTCRAGDRSTKVAVIFIRADAPAAEWSRLVQSPGASAGPSAGSGPAAAHAHLRTYVFPDGTGSIGLAEGWTTRAQSAMQGVFVEGPRDQLIAIGVSFSVLTPASTLPRGPMTLVAPFSAPIDALEALVPQLSRASVQQGGPARTIDHPTKVEDRKPTLPNGRQSLVRFGVTESKAGSSEHYQAIAQVELDPVTQTSFLLGITQLRAPDATFERDLPVMQQILQSMKSNDALITRKSGEAIAAQKQWFNRQQSAHRAQVDAFDAHNRQWQANERASDERNRTWEANQNAQARRDDNFDELIRGYRSVEDTQTGFKTSVDLGNVDKIVDDLNEREPGRYRQIPLRDENDPVPGR
jgi:hypothetical protein